MLVRQQPLTFGGVVLGRHIQPNQETIKVSLYQDDRYSDNWCVVSQGTRDDGQVPNADNEQPPGVLKHCVELAETGQVREVAWKGVAAETPLVLALLGGQQEAAKALFGKLIAGIAPRLLSDTSPENCEKLTKIVEESKEKVATFLKDPNAKLDYNFHGNFSAPTGLGNGELVVTLTYPREKPAQ